MKNTFGNALTVTLFGESHGAYIGATLDGLAPGMSVDADNIRRMLFLRAPRGNISTARHEADEVQIVSGVVDGVTTGTPLTLLIQNGDTKSGDYAAMKTVMRPSHADYPAQCKYHGFQDTRGGGHFSGRITAALVAALAVGLIACRTDANRRQTAMDANYRHAYGEVLNAVQELDSSLQKSLYERQVQKQKNAGYSDAKAREVAATIVKKPGQSEHNTGLAADLGGSGDYSLNQSFERTAAYRWLIANCVDYGFILRFPKNKEAITGVIYEPWHFRYVGKEAAAEIMRDGLRLEEYLEKHGY